MSMLVKITLITTLVLSIVVPFGYYLIGEKKKNRYKKAISANAFSFFAILLIASIMMFGGSASAAVETEAASGLATGLGYIAAGLVTGLSGIGSGIAVASSASAALGAISEDSSIFGKSMIFVAMAEGIALYGLIISFMILSKI